MAAALSIISKGWKGLVNLFYPSLCYSCGCKLQEDEQVLCADCTSRIMRTDMAEHRDNRVENLFWDIKKLQVAAAFSIYNDQMRRIIHKMKYGRSPQIGEYLGYVAGKEFMEKHFFDGIDLIVPIPLHPKRERKRGYNQAEHICIGLSRATGIPIDKDNLYRKRNNESQTQKTLTEREANTKDLFAVRQEARWRGKHILLVDDIITTGSTLRSAMSVITPIRKTTISVFGLAAAGGQSSHDDNTWTY